MIEFLSFYQIDNMPNVLHDLQGSIALRLLYESSVIAVRDYRCIACRGGPSAEESISRNDIVIVRHGMFCKQYGRHRATIDINQVAFFSKGAPFHISHPADCGDRGTIFTLAPDVLVDIIREFAPSVDDHLDQPFPFLTGPCDPISFWQHREFTRWMENSGSDPLDPLEADVKALQIMVRVLTAAFTHQSKLRPHRQIPVNTDHVERIETAKAYLACHQASRVSLADVASEAHLSSFHFARLFHKYSGLPVHRYLNRLRLRAALEHLAEGAIDLTTLAFDLGFSSHAHFTSAFRREFGCAPSDLRRSYCHRTLRKISKNLKA